LFAEVVMTNLMEGILLVSCWSSEFAVKFLDVRLGWICSGVRVWWDAPQSAKEVAVGALAQW